MDEFDKLNERNNAVKTTLAEATRADEEIDKSRYVAILGVVAIVVANVAGNFIDMKGIEVVRYAVDLVGVGLIAVGFIRGIHFKNQAKSLIEQARQDQAKVNKDVTYAEVEVKSIKKQGNKIGDPRDN